MGVIHVLRSNLFDLSNIGAVTGPLSRIFISLQLWDVMAIRVPATPGDG
jgi:hypothetical protein